MEKNYRNIGKIVSSFGVRGEMVIIHHLGPKLAISKIKVIFLEPKKDELLPYFVEYAKKRGQDELLVKLEGVETKESVTKFLRREVWIRESEVQLHTQKKKPHRLGGLPCRGPGKGLGRDTRNY